MMDSAMLQDIYFGNAFEIRAGQIAQNRGKSAWTTEFGKEMVQEHTFAQNEVKQLAQERNVSLDNDLPGEMLQSLRHLQNVPSASFDAAFKEAILSSHAQASNILKHAIKFGHDEEVRGLAVKLEPSVIHHYSLAMSGKTMMGPTMATGGG